MGQAQSTAGRHQPFELELSETEVHKAGTSLQHIQSLRNVYLRDTSPERYHSSASDEGHIIEANSAPGTPTGQGGAAVRTPLSKRPSRGLPELLTDSPRAAPVRAKSTRLSRAGSEAQEGTKLAAVRTSSSQEVSFEPSGPHRAASIEPIPEAPHQQQQQPDAATAELDASQELEDREEEVTSAQLAQDPDTSPQDVPCRQASPFSSPEQQMWPEVPEQQPRQADAAQPEAISPLKAGAASHSSSGSMAAPSTPDKGDLLRPFADPVSPPGRSSLDTPPGKELQQDAMVHHAEADSSINQPPALPAQAGQVAASSPEPALLALQARFEARAAGQSSMHAEPASASSNGTAAGSGKAAQHVPSEPKQQAAQPSALRAAGASMNTWPSQECRQAELQGRAGKQAGLRPSQSFSAQQEAAFEPGMRQLGAQLPEQLPAGEVQFFANFLTARLASSCRPQLSSSCNAQQLAAACRDGICLSKLLNACVPESIDERALNVPEQPGNTLPDQSALENAMLCVNAARALGCAMSSVAAEDIVAGKTAPIMECLWQIIRLGLLTGVSLKVVPELVVLQGPEESAEALLATPPEALLLRWAAHHLRQPAARSLAGCEGIPAPVDFGDSWQDGRVLAVLLHVLAPQAMGQPALRESADVRWRGISAACSQLSGEGHAQALPSTQLLQAGQPRMLLAALAMLFTSHPGLDLVGKAAQEQLAGFVAWLEEYDLGAPREERTFSVWLSSLLDAPLRRGLVAELKDGQVLLKAMDRLSPGCVDWRQVRSVPPRQPLLRRPVSVETCNQAVAVARDLLGLPLVNIGGIDVYEGQKKLVLSLLWQLMRAHMRCLLQAVSSRGSSITDAELDAEVLTWANAKVASSGRSSSIRSFADPSLGKGHFLADLLAAVQPGCVNFALLKPGTSREECELNAKYVISTARKLGCFLFLVWEDLVEVNSRMILVLIACILATSQLSAGPARTLSRVLSLRQPSAPLPPSL